MEATAPVADSIHTAPGWRVLGEKPYFTGVYPPGREPAPEVVRAIKEICPDVVPMWMSERYLPPNSSTPVTLGWHILARHLWNPSGPHVQLGAIVPADWEGPVPNLWEIPFQGEVGPDGNPPGYEPLDWRTVAMLRRRYQVKGSEELILRVLQDNRVRRMRAKRRLMQEEAYKRHDVNAWIRRRLATWSVDDWNELHERGRLGGNH